MSSSLAQHQERGLFAITYFEFTVSIYLNIFSHL
jgi:hypothetical protein